MKKSGKILSLLLVLVCTLTACGADPLTDETGNTVNDKESGKIKIGFSQTGNQVGWRIAQTKSIIENGKKLGYEIVYTDAQEDTEQQIRDVQDILAEGVEYLIFDPREYEASAKVLDYAKEAKVPVIVVDRDVVGEPGTDYVTLVAPDVVWEGQQAAEWLKNAKNGHAKIVEITGTPGSSAMIDRQKGFMDVVNEEEDMVIITSETGNFTRAEAQKTMEKIIETRAGQFDTIFAHSDEMAIGVLQALKSAGIMPGKDVMVIGIDGQKEAVQAIIDGEMACTVTCSPNYGPIVFDIIEKLLNGEPVESSIVMPDYIIDRTNAAQELDKAF